MSDPNGFEETSDLPLRRALHDHLESFYGKRIRSLAPIDDDPATRPRGSWPGHYPDTLLVRRSDAPPLIARVSSAASEVLEGDAEILRFLAAQSYPAERLVGERPVSSFDGGSVMITEFIEGGRPTHADGRVESAAVHRELGGLLGRLHALPMDDGAPVRPGAAEVAGDGTHTGRPVDDLAGALSFLSEVGDQLDAAGGAISERLRTQIENGDDAAGLPESLTHSNFHAWTAVGTPGDLHIVGWAGSGRGPRLPALAWLLTTAAEGSPEFVDAALQGYTEHVHLTANELDRLDGVLAIKPLWLACLEFRQMIRGGQTPTADAGWIGWSSDRAQRIADRVLASIG